MKFFNTTGPCNPDDHYMLPPAERLVGAQLNQYIRDKLYWTLHAPRQTGKTTFLKSWMRKLNEEGNVIAAYVTIEGCQGVEDPAEAWRIIFTAIDDAALEIGFQPPRPATVVPETLFADAIKELARMAAPKPLVILFDEVDVLEGPSLIRFLRLLRAGFSNRGVGVFPISIALVGMRDLKDYITMAKDGVRVNPGSPFNIKIDSVSIDNFTMEHIVRLFAQRTKETGQKITPEALEYVWEQSRGQPWIVNNFFQRATRRVLNENNFETVELHHVQKALEQIILARETHLDALEYRLYDPEVRRVVSTLINGDHDLEFINTDGYHLALDLGLIARVDGEITVANPIYREVLARRITYAAEVNIGNPSNFQWQTPDGKLDMAALLREFQQFWVEHSEAWEQKSDYTEVFPQLLLMAFLQRIVNGGGHISREYALGRGRMDLLVEFEGTRNVIEIKILRDKVSYERLLATGLAQIKRYRDQINPATPAYLLIFDRRSDDAKAPWDERIYWREAGDGITVVGV